MTFLGKMKKKNNIHIKRLYSALNNSLSLSEDINKTLANNYIENSEYIKLNDILNIIKEINESLYNDKELIENGIEKKVMNKYGSFSSIVIYHYNENTIELGFTKNYKLKHYKKIIINLKAEKKSELYYLIKEEIDKLLVLYKTYEYFMNIYQENIRAINSSLKVNISLFNISVFISKNTYSYEKLLNIKYSGYEDKYYVFGDSELVECVKGREIDLLNSIYISKKDCPSYYRNEVIKRKRKKYKVKKI